MKEKLQSDFNKKLKVLNETIWENKISFNKINTWLANFEEDEKIHALFLLTQFIYFGDFQIKKMLAAIYRDFFKYSQIEKIRKINGNTKNLIFINDEYKKILKKTRFVSLGNPSESSSLLMYSFRQENKLPKSYFISDADIQTYTDDVENFVFLDDMCGSGEQAVKYSQKILPVIKSRYPKADTHYYMLLATKDGKERIKKESDFTFVDSIMDLDNTFKCFSPDSRIFKNVDSLIDPIKTKEFCEKYGLNLMFSISKTMFRGLSDSDLMSWADYNKLGFGDGQLLLGFHHNTPDNSLPIIWYNEEEINWTPIFKRINKKYDD